ncbi:hypothetical protein J5N97_027037 [Dioscorea zingiberensis]|uniref:Protein POLAR LOCALIZATION DURING ASYMMETRIC DIVISION AND REDISTRIBUTION n=1 Tax=Dioscorea zingiberensis TaxID=325984 RepID=A0A9D5H787_9LILI|nr:hypothetical protein J5N97_027037 [Dioscorea zingiberensis]
MEKDKSSSGGAIPAYSPRFLLSRWLGSPEDGSLGCRVRFPRHGGKKRRERRGGDGEESESDRVKVVEKLEVKEGVREIGKEFSDSSGHESKDVVSPNLGMGVGLIFLLVRTATEFNKMIELRKEMEVLLRDIKDEIRKKDAMSTRADSTSITFSVSDNSRNKNQSENDRASIHAIRTHCPTESDDSQSKCEIISENKNCLKMDQMEAELEVEFQRLHLSLEANDSLVLPPHLGMELPDGGSSPTESLSESFGGDDEDDNEGSSEHFGVKPRELERKLHELLEAQQQERIAELESALELAEQRLHEKENEICWWRDTARLASQRKDAAIYRLAP